MSGNNIVFNPFTNNFDYYPSGSGINNANIFVNNALPFQKLTTLTNPAFFVNSYKNKELHLITIADSPYYPTYPEYIEVDTSSGSVQIFLPLADENVNSGMEYFINKISEDGQDLTVLVSGSSSTISGHDEIHMWKHNSSITIGSKNNMWNIIEDNRSNPQVLSVSPKTNDIGNFDTIRSAVNWANSYSLGPTIIRVQAGEHIIDDTIIISCGYAITILGEGVNSTVLQTSASLISKSVFEINSDAKFDRFTVDSIDNWGTAPQDIIFKYNVPAISSEIQDIITFKGHTVIDCQYANNLWIFNSSFQNVYNTGIYLTSGGYAGITAVDIQLSDNVDTIGMHLSDTNTEIEMYQLDIKNQFDMTKGVGVYLESGSEMHIYPGSEFNNLATAIKINNANIHIHGSTFYRISGNNIELETASITIVDCTADNWTETILYDTSSSFLINSFDNTKGYYVLGNQVSTFGFPSQSATNGYGLVLSGSNQLVWQKTFISSSIPASISASGDTGMLAYENNYLYVCVDTNTWGRTVLATF
jgi:hypothetical protein